MIKKPTKQWMTKAQYVFGIHIHKQGATPNLNMLEMFYSDGLSARHAGKLCAFLAISEEEGNLDLFEYWKV